MYTYLFLAFLCCVSIVFGDKAALIYKITKTRFQYRENHNYAVRIQHRDKKGKYHYICSGTIINSKWILTAAHAIDEFDIHDLRVVYDSDLKEYNKSVFSPRHVSKRNQGFGVFKRILHPKWVVGNKVLPAEYDIAILCLTFSIKLPEHYDGLHLPLAMESYKRHVDYELPATLGVTAVYKRRLGIPSQCIEVFDAPGCNVHVLDPSFSRNYIDGFICDKTVGAPLFERRHRYHDILFGIITLEVLPHEKSPVSIFTYVTPYIDFIKEHVNTRVNPIKYVKK